MTIRRSAAAVGAVAFGLFALSACTKPTPLATVTVGKTSVHTEAACYDNGKSLSTADFTKCLNSTPSETVDVSSGDTVHVGVDPAIADKGWVVVVDQQGASGRLTSTYHTFSPDLVNQFFTDSSTGQQKTKVTLTIVENSGAQSYQGVWHFALQLKG
ncbi:hypothetical protein [Streptomyces sp. ICBB 8177]|uniref:hypothetical protein n=1 Tax=Streptomyces sp. ICBB 8177 TaxID=563922 RepID=UPI000D679927|nr:hypothetical protein [Streptomyces sp. ICBB 8177]PWI45881.1 hypothetical protein CK485_01630 [Streptomyces sp. ICBB 8177]